MQFSENIKSNIYIFCIKDPLVPLSTSTWWTRVASTSMKVIDVNETFTVTKTLQKVGHKMREGLKQLMQSFRIIIKWNTTQWKTTVQSVCPHVGFLSIPNDQWLDLNHINDCNFMIHQTGQLNNNLGPTCLLKRSCLSI